MSVCHASGRFVVLAIGLIVAAATLPAFAGNVYTGEDVFLSECARCHSPTQGRPNKGPSLLGIVGRQAGGLTDYHYSSALSQANWRWSINKLRTYLSLPSQQATPGTTMEYKGLGDPKDLDDLLTYLDTLH